MNELRQSIAAAGLDASTLEVLIELEPRSVYRLEHVGGERAVTAWKKLRTIVGNTSYWPILLGTPEEVARRGDLEDVKAERIKETLDFAKSIDGKAWFARRQQERLDDFIAYNPGEDPSRFSASDGDWPQNAAPSSSFYTPFDTLSRKPHPAIVFGLVPTAVPWEIPAFLQLGNWNECPEAAVHCAVMKYWNEAYGSEMLASTHDVIECVVPRPPQTREKAVELAREQYNYCADIVEQGTETISVLAAALLNAPVWFFWWD